MTDDWTPREWVRRLRERDPTTWSFLFQAVDRFARQCWYLDEDAIHEAFVRLLLALDDGTFKEDEMKSGSPVPWVITVAKHVLTDVIRKQRRVISMELIAEDLEAVIASALEEFIKLGESERRARLLAEAIARLKPQLQAVIKVIYFSDENRTITAKEAAQILGTTEGTVEAMKNRALNQIRQYIRERGESIQPRTTENGKPLGRPKGSGKKAKEKGATQEAQL